MLAQNIPLDEFLRYASDEELLAARDKLMNMAEEYENFSDLFDSAEQADMRMNDLESEVGQLNRDLLQYQTALELVEKAHLFAKDIEAGYLTHNALMDRAHWMVTAIDKFNSKPEPVVPRMKPCAVKIVRVNKCASIVQRRAQKRKQFMKGLK